MAYTEITDHATRALARLKTIFSTSVEFRGILSALALECQALETAILSVRDSIRNTDNGAAGNTHAMVQVAKLVGARPIGTLPAADYVNLINAQIQVNKSQGAPEDLINVYNAMFAPYIGPLRSVVDVADPPGSEGYSAGVGALHLMGGISIGNSITLEQARNGMALIHSASPAGNRTIVTMGVFPITNIPGMVGVFFCDTSPTDDPDYALLASFDSPSTVR